MFTFSLKGLNALAYWQWVLSYYNNNPSVKPQIILSLKSESILAIWVGNLECSSVWTSLKVSFIGQIKRLCLVLYRGLEQRRWHTRENLDMVSNERNAIIKWFEIYFRWLSFWLINNFQLISNCDSQFQILNMSHFTRPSQIVITSDDS